MKLKHLAAFLMLLAIGCTQQPASTSTAAPESGDTAAASDASETSTEDVEPATETLASSTVSFDVTGMS